MFTSVARARSWEGRRAFAGRFRRGTLAVAVGAGCTLALLLAGCYSQPDLSPSKPLRCTVSDASAECPVGYSCVAGVCALANCHGDVECPAGLVCRAVRGCVVPGGPGDSDGATDLATDLVIGDQAGARGDGSELDAGAADVAPPRDAALGVDGGLD